MRRVSRPKRSHTKPIGRKSRQHFPPVPATGPIRKRDSAESAVHASRGDSVRDYMRARMPRFARVEQAAKEVAIQLHPAAVLTGLAAGWQWLGMRTILTSVIDPLPATATMLGVLALLAAALGPWFPERIVLSVTRFIGRRSRRAAGPMADSTGTFWMLRAVRNREESLLWLAVSVMASAAGVVSLITLAASGIFIRFYHALLTGFFWTKLTLTSLEWISVTLFIGTSWVFTGLLVTTLAPVVHGRSASPRDPPGVAAGVLVGFGLAWMSYELFADWGLSGHQGYMLGVLGMFALALMSARFSQRADRLPLIGAGADEDAPEVTAGAEGLIWLSLIVWGMASVLVGSGWLACHSRAVTEGQTGDWSLSWYVLIVGVGLVAASFQTRRRTRSASGCGMALWAAGVGSAAAATLIAYRPAGTPAGVVQVVLLALPVGYALHYMERAWLARVGSETLGFAQMTSAILAGLALGMIMARWWASPALGAMGMMTTGSLMMLAFGGLMQIYEQDRPVRIRHQRLALIFASLAGVIVLFPADAKQWASWERQYKPSAPVAGGFEPLDISGMLPLRNVCLIGVKPAAALHWPVAENVRIDVIPISTPYSMPSRLLNLGDNTRVLKTNAFRIFRLESQRYDIIYQRVARSDSLQRFAEYSAEWLTQIAERASVGGHVVIDVPLAGMTFETVTVIAATFEYSMGVPAFWRVFTDPAGQPTLRLGANLEADAGTVMRQVFKDLWSPVKSLYGDQSVPSPHSIWRDRITRTMKAAAGDQTSAPLLEKLGGYRNHAGPGGLGR